MSIARRLLLGAVLTAVLVGPGRAAVLRPCERAAPIGAEQQDLTLRLAAIVKAELERSGRGAVLIARSGIDFVCFGFCISHVGIVLKVSRNGCWSVR